MLDRIQNPDARQQPPAPESPEPEFSPDERDYRSVIDVLEKNNRSVSMAVLGKARRRWLERPPRDPSSPQPNRLYDVLANMMRDGVLTKQGTRYVPGPDYARYLGTPDLVGAWLLSATSAASTSVSTALRPSVRIWQRLQVQSMCVWLDEEGCVTDDDNGNTRASVAAFTFSMLSYWISRTTRLFRGGTRGCKSCSFSCRSFSSNNS